MFGLDTRRTAALTIVVVCANATVAVGEEDPLTNETPSSTEARNAGDVDRPSTLQASRGEEPKAIPGSTFSDPLRGGGEGPKMVVIPAGLFWMGCLSNDDDCEPNEKPVHDVSIPAPFALSVYEVTFGDYDRFKPPFREVEQGLVRRTRPVFRVWWKDAKSYAAWLSEQTGAEYRLPTEAEWEYAARAGSATKYSWGDHIGMGQANCYTQPGAQGCGSQWDGMPALVGSHPPNAFGLHDMHGNMFEWVEDCWNDTYAGAPQDGSAWLRGDCSKRVVRGGSWNKGEWWLRAAARHGRSTGDKNNEIGFRVARTLRP